ncbi:MAG: undecaprenyldiphospho-muramoylpentapeptide beta-N-acetylglucosaminyltransferase [Bryobacteraceae bacterium]
MMFFMAGGGTGGHIIPALAVARELRRNGHDAVFIGTRKGMEARLVPQAGFPIEWIEIGGINRVGFVQKLRALWQLPISIFRVFSMMRRLKPGAVFSMGGYVAGPVMLAALLRRLPVVVMEPNALPGLTNRRLGRWCAKALVNFQQTTRWFPKAVQRRPEFRSRRIFAIEPKPAGTAFTLLITGGSQGSRTLNRSAQASWPLFANSSVHLRIVHQTGRQGAGLGDAFQLSGLEGEVVEFIPDMPRAFAQADLILCRSGASTVAELAAAGKPSILVPFPFAADNHQFHNADAMAKAGAAEVILDFEMNGQLLFERVSSLFANRERLAAMAKAAKGMAHPQAAVRSAELLQQVAQR